MATIMFDTHAFIKRLQQSGFNEEQAEALSDAFRKTQEAHLEELATKQDLKELEIKIDAKLAEMKTDLLKWLMGLLFLQAGFIVALIRLL